MSNKTRNQVSALVVKNGIKIPDDYDLASAIKASMDGIAINNENREFIYVNNSFIKIYGYNSQKELIGKNWKILYDENEVKRLEEKVEPEFFKKGFWRGEAIGIKRNGAKFFQEVLLSLTEDGRVIRIIRDISLRKKAEKALEESELKYRSLIENLQEFVLYQDNNNTIMFANKRLCRFFGYTEEELFGTNGYDMLYDEKDFNIINEKNLLREQGISDFYEIRLKKKNGELVWAYINGTPYYDINRNIIGSITIITDITEQKKSEEALKETEIKFRTIFENSVDAISVSHKGNHVFVNPAYISLFGYESFEELKEISIFNVLAPSVRERAKNFSEMRTKGNPIPSVYESKGLKKDNTEFDMEIHISNYKLQDELYFVAIVRDITERIRARKALEESEFKYRSLIGNLQEAVFYLDNDAVLIYANKRCCDIFGYELEELIGISSHDLIYDENDIEFIDEKNKLREQGISDVYEVRCKRKNGELIWCHINGTPYNDEKGNVIGSITIVTDITEQKKYKDALIESEIKFQAIFESSIDAIGVSKNGITILINPAFVSLFGYDSIFEMEGKSESYLIAPRERKRILEYSKKRIKGGSAPDSYISKGLRKDGTEFTLEIHVSSYKLEGESYDIAILRDITQLELAQIALKESEERYRTLISTSPDAINVVDITGKIQITNQRSVEMFRYKNKEELIGKTYFDLLIEEEKQISKEATVNIIKVGYARNLERTMLRKDGTTFNADLSISVIKDSLGNPRYIIAIIRDITVRKQIEVQLRKYAEEQVEINATKDKLYSIVAHDLRSPFQSLLGYSEMLKNNAENLKTDKIISFAENIYATSSETYNLLENLLQWTALQSGRIKATAEIINVKKIFDSTINSLKEIAGKKNIKLFSHLKKDLSVLADNNMIMVIIRNLIYNSIKFTDREGKIILNAKEKNNKIFISVTDNGVGIPKEYVSKLFKIESTYSTRGTEKEKGTGLGLIICKEFAESNKGKLSVHSQPGKGSEFILSLPKF